MPRLRHTHRSATAAQAQAQEHSCRARRRPIRAVGRRRSTCSPPRWSATQPKYIAVNCRHCDTLMYATEKQVGHSITCPDCGKSQKVLPPAKPKPARSVLASDADTPKLDPAFAPAERPPVSLLPGAQDGFRNAARSRVCQGAGGVATDRQADADRLPRPAHHAAPAARDRRVADARDRGSDRPLDRAIHFARVCGTVPGTKRS